MSLEIWLDDGVKVSNSDKDCAIETFFIYSCLGWSRLLCVSAAFNFSEHEIYSFAAERFHIKGTKAIIIKFSP
jgi:hypothetical protein